MDTAHLKIIFAGSVGAGKSSSIQAISDIELVNTEEIASDEVRLMKETTTVAMDYGQMNLEDGTKLHLYGAPGQKRFDFMWEILAEGAIGIILLIDDAAADPMAELNDYLQAFKGQLNSRSMVIGITRTDLSESYELNAYRDLVSSYDTLTPVFTVDAREEFQVKTLVRALLYRMDPWLN
ncbi:MAG: ATP/GTP-binding protein [Gammaproteobacteria bacterium]|nr:ATP/GTP-binding protein [Gammaproteobacteria bacterium]